MVPQAIGPNQERGYYIVWDTVNWRKERVRCPLLFQAFRWTYLTDSARSASLSSTTATWTRRLWGMGRSTATAHRRRIQTLAGMPWSTESRDAALLRSQRSPGS